MPGFPNLAACAVPCAGAHPAGLWARLRRALAAFFPPRRRRLLDPRTLSDHLRRDIGIADGNDPRGPRP